MISEEAYQEIMNFVQKTLEENGGERDSKGRFPFRKRSEHIQRVYTWAVRLLEEDSPIDKEALLLAALFHDIGYDDMDNADTHQIRSAEITKRYLEAKNYENSLVKRVCYLVENHSEKDLLWDEDTPLDLVLLMEADLLDETGALAIVWDTMMEARKENATFEQVYNHILDFSHREIQNCPMKTEKAKLFWKQKECLVNSFLSELKRDLFLE